MEPDPGDMKIQRDLHLLLFAVREGDTRLAELIAAALGRERRGPAIPRRWAGEPSPLARRTFNALVARLALEE
jgi:hypothetical protein